MNNDIVLYIDEEEQARDTFSVTLQDWFGEDVKVEAIEPLNTIEAMIEYLGEKKNLVSLVLDQRLNLSGTARYEGADLADSCRSILPHLPIYIFTNHPEDFIEGDNMGEILGPGTVEYVLSKNDTADAEKQDKISMRVRRHISQFNNISRSIDNRLHELLEKKVKGTLDPGEENELDKINHFRSRPIVSAEALGTASLKKILDANEILLTKLEKRIKSI